MNYLARFIFILLGCSITFIAHAQSFPEISTQTVEQERLVIPNDLAGKKSIVFLAFTKEAERVLEEWYYPVYTLFIDPNGFNSMAYDCHVHLIMMFTGIGQSVGKNIIEHIRTEVDPVMGQHLLFYQGDFRTQMKELELTKKKEAYVFVLDEKGEILLQSSGHYTEGKLEKIADLVEL